MPATFKSYLRKLQLRLDTVIELERDSRYILLFLFSLAGFLIVTLLVRDKLLFNSLERPVFDWFNGWPPGLHLLLYIITQLGTLGAVVLWGGLGWYLINRRGGITVGAAGVIGWLVAKAAKAWVHRGRPAVLLPHVHLFGHGFSGYGFPSGHSTVSAACAAALYYQVPRRWRKYPLAAVLLVGISRLYLGAHLPFDVLGGWLLGMAIGSLVVVAAGTSVERISPERLKTLLSQRGYHVRRVQFARVDARGSRPFFIDAGGHKYFAKIFGAPEHAADWLYKTYRHVRYKNLGGEEPFLKSKHNVEREILAMFWAAKAGARVTQVVDLVPLEQAWVLIQNRIDGSAMPGQTKIADASLADAWRQVEKLHKHRIAHRDLRAANLIIDRKGQVWVTDFGFAELAAPKRRIYIDRAELLVSLAMVVGPQRAVKAALKIVSKKELKHSLPYLQKAALNFETIKQVTQNPSVLKDLKRLLIKELNVKYPIKEANLVRFSLRKLIWP